MAEEKRGNILEPGTVIRPVIDHEGVKLLAERLYGITVLELTELNGYDDKNYKIIEDPNMKNPLIPNHCEYGYVLKIMNSIDSMNSEVVEAQNEIMNYLHARSVVCPKPIRNVYGHLYSIETISGKKHAVRLLEYVPGEILCDVPKSEALFYQLGEFVANIDSKLQLKPVRNVYHLYSIETISGKKHAVRLLEYVPGEILCDVPKSEALFYQLGEFVANIDSKLQNFNHSGLATREHIWMLTKVPELEKFKYVIKDSDQLDLVEEVIEEFKYAVVPRLEELERGVIHGDFNEMNIVVGLKPGGSKTDYRVTGILDFGDIQYSYYVFEVAIAMTYMMLLSGDPRTGGIVLAGYTVTRRLPDDEYRLLKTLVSARLVQSLVLGAYTAQSDPSNTYVKSTEKANGWELLRKIRKTKPSPDGDPTDWKTIANEYLTKS